ncbi:MAG TPA: ubiquinone biosynthesis regulatory protein kinase UbiB [Gammaproteobacteria bacterium]|nr:ubiquinone biosynthesis regulatory protein kinase UbiB [Gammaproteobacteria bacterium]
MGPRQLLRITRINLVLLKHGLDELILDVPLFKPLRFLKGFMFWRWLKAPSGTRGERIRGALEDLGPIFIKFGQILSTRRDLLPQDIAVELARLQDRVPPFAGADARRIVEAELGEPLNAIFTHFDETPLASASIAQVHAAQLPNGAQAVVKVIRPGIERVIRDDIQLMYAIADLAERYIADARRLQPREVVAEFEKTIYDELDLMREAANASQLKRNFKDSTILHVPEVYWPHVRRNVMVMERIHGIPVSDIDQLRARGVDLQRLAERGVEIFFTQVFRDSFFHADMHPGNIFVDASDPTEPKYIAVDFGIVGTLAPADHRYLAENFIAFFNRDYRRVAELHIESGWVPADTRVNEFEAAMRTVCEPIFERPLSEISFGALLLRLFQTGRRFDMEVQPQLVLLQKTLLNIEGLGRDLYPELDLWKTAKPYMEGWMRQQIGVGSIARRIRQELPIWSERLPGLPARINQALDDLSAMRRHMAEYTQEIEHLRRQIRNNGRRNVAAAIGSACILGAFILLAGSGRTLEFLTHIPALGWALGAVGAMLLLFTWPQR